MSPSEWDNSDVRLKFLFVVWVFGVWLPASVSAAQLLSNASVEKYHGDAYLAGWDVRSTTASIINTNTANSHTGNNSLGFDLSSASGPFWGHEIFAVRPGESNAVAFWFKTVSKFSTGGISASVRWWADASRQQLVGKVLLRTGMGGSNPAPWMSVTQFVTVPTNAAFADLLLDGSSASGPAGLVFFDDFSFSPLTATAAEAKNPGPVDGATDTPLSALLSWTPSRDTRNFLLYLGTNYSSVASATTNNPEFLDTVRPLCTNVIGYGVTLHPYTQYFWRVDAVAVDGTIATGNVWSLTTGFNYAEDIAQSTAYRFDSKDNLGIGLDVIHIIPNPASAGYIGVHHSLITNQFQVRLVLSTELLHWNFVRTLEPNGGMPALIFHSQSGGFILVHEQWSPPGAPFVSQLRFRFYANYSDLLGGIVTRDFLAPLSSFHSTPIEGTPNFFNVSSDGNTIEVGFHYYADNGRDRTAYGTLTGFLSGAPGWTSRVAVDLNNALLNKQVDDIGARDFDGLFGSNYLVQEGEDVFGDFGTWRMWFYDYSRSASFPLFPKTPKGSRSVGYGTRRFLTAPSGKPAVLTTYFVFSEESANGEPGQLIFYTEVEMAASALTVIPTGGSDGGFHLRWLSGVGAVGHDVYVGDDAMVIASATTNSPIYAGRFSRPHIDLANLAPNTVYYVRVDEVGFGNSITPGVVWSFSTPSILRIAGSRLAGSTLTVSGSGGPPNGIYCVLSSPETAFPLSRWTPFQTNRFDGSGDFSFTYFIDDATPVMFFSIRLP